MKNIPALAAVLLASVSLSAGCGQKSPTAPASSLPTNESAAQASISAVLAQSPQIVDDGQFDSNEAATLSGGTGTLAGVRPLQFWRKIDHVTRTVEYAFSDTDSTGKPTRAVVTVRKVFTGTFNLRALAAVSDTGTDSARTTFHKPLEDHWVRRIELARMPHHYYPGWGGGDHRRGDHDGGPRDSTEDWRVVGTSAVQVTSANAQTQITSVRVQTADLDSTITDPLSFFQLRDVLHFNHNDQVTLTVTTLRNDDVVFLLLRGHRIMFANQGDNTYKATLPMPREECVFSLRHIGVNAFSHGTLFDDQLPYDSQAWIAPFAVRPYEMAVYLP